MMKALKQLPRGLMVLVIVSLAWSWMEPPFFAYGGHIYATNRLLAIGVFLSYYVGVFVLIILGAREIAKVTGISFRSLLKYSFKNFGARGAAPAPSQVDLRQAPRVGINTSELFDALMDMDVAISTLVTDEEGTIDEEFMDKVRHYEKVITKLCGLEQHYADFLGLDQESFQKRVDQEYEQWKQKEPGTWTGKGPPKKVD